MRPISPETKRVIEELRKELDELSEMQSKARQTAVYVGFPKGEKNAYDERLDRIRKLRRELFVIEESTHGCPSTE